MIVSSVLGISMCPFIIYQDTHLRSLFLLDKHTSFLSYFKLLILFLTLHCKHPPLPSHNVLTSCFKLSIENHCGLEQQQRMAYHMKSIFKEMLYLPKGDISILPSPDDLKEKILLKGILHLIFYVNNFVIFFLFFYFLFCNY